MTDSNERARPIFHAALSLVDPGQRADYLSVACRGDDLLRNQVDSLLLAHEEAGEFMENAAVNSQQIDLPVADVPSQTIDRYKLLQQIGEGGFGVVYMAEQQQPVVRRVALKIVKAGMDTRQVIARFEAERQALAMMEHPNIAKVFDAGETDNGRPYFVMELVPGVSIVDYCDQQKLPNERRLVLFRDICGAIQHAHQKGIIHRDLKPSNILVTLHDGKPVPKVIDFGIAKATQQRLTDKTLFTRFEQFIGTPAYMSPEQAEMSGLDVDTRSDIYSLGVLLYELLTGQTPFDRKEFAEAGFDEIRRRIREEEPATPSHRLISLQRDTLTAVAEKRNADPTSVSALLMHELDWIVMKAMDKDRSRRYESVSALSDDVDRFLKQQPVTAAPPSAAYLVRKFVHRNRALLAIVGVIAATLVVAAVVSSWQAVNAIQARNQLANEVAAKAQAVTRARQVAYASDMHNAYQALRLNNLKLARTLVDRNRGLPDGTDLRNWEWRALWKQCQGDEVSAFDASDSISSISVGTDGEWLAAGGYRSGPCVWNARTGELIRELSPEVPKCVAIAVSGDRLYVASSDGIVKTWSVPSFLESEFEFRHGGPIRDIGISNDGKRLAIFGDEQISLWNLDSPDSSTKPAKFHAGTGRRMGDTEGRVAMSPDDSLLAIGVYGRTRIVDLVTLNEQREIPRGAKHALAFSPNGQFLAIGTSFTDSTVYLHRVADGELIARLVGHTHCIYDADFSPDGRILATASADQTIRLWDTETRTQVAALRGHTDEVMCLEFTEDGERLISGSLDGQICVWNPQRSFPDWPTTVANAVPNHLSQYSRASFSSEGKYLATRNRDDSVSLRSTKTLEEIRRVPELGSSNRGVRYSPSESLLAAGNANGYLTFIDPNEPEETKSVELARGADISPVNFSRDGSRLLVLAHNPTQTFCIICSVPDGLTLHKWSIPSDDRCAAFSPDGGLVVTGHSDRTNRIWKVANPHEPIVKHQDSLCGAVAFSPLGDKLLICSRKAEADLLDTSSFSSTVRLQGHMLRVNAAAFSPDGTRVATGGGPGEPVKIWDVATGRELMTLFVEGFVFSHVEFSPSGDSVLAIGGSGSLHLWRVPTLEQIQASELATGNRGL